MERLRLKNTVSITGTTAKGTPAHILLEPIEETNERHGWELCLKNVSIPVGPTHLTGVGSELALIHQSYTLPCVAHLIALRTLIGLDAVRIHIKDTLPFCGSLKFFLEHVRTSVEVCGKLEPYVLPQLSVGSRSSSVKILKDSRPLSIRAHLYVGMTHKRCNYFSALKNSVDEFASARMAGEQRLRLLALVAARTRLEKYWPHFLEYVWQSGTGHTEHLGEVLQHRIVDILGALAVVTPPGRFLCGTILESNSTAALDLELLEAIEKTETLHT